MANTQREISEFTFKIVLISRTKNINAINFELPKTINIYADDYPNMMDWSKQNDTQPPVLKCIGNNHLLKIKVNF